MKEKISAKIKELVKTNNLTNLSERTIEGVIELASKRVTKEEDLTDAFYQNELQLLTLYNGQLYADIKDAVEKAKIAPPTPTPTPQKSITELPKVELPKEIISELEEMKKFRDEVQRQRAENEAKALREKTLKDVKTALVAQGCKDDIFLENALYGIDYNSDVTANVTTLKKTYNDKYAEAIKAGEFIPRSPEGFGAKTFTPEEREKIEKEAYQRLKEQQKV